MGNNRMMKHAATGHGQIVIVAEFSGDMDRDAHARARKVQTLVDRLLVHEIER